MSNHIVAITDKVMRMIRSMVYLALKLEPHRGGTAQEICAYLDTRAEGEYHTGIIERALEDLQYQGKVRQLGPRWYLVAGVG